MSPDDGLVPPGPPPPPPGPGRPAAGSPVSAPPPGWPPTGARTAAGAADKPLGWTGFALSFALCVPLLPAAGAVVAIVTLARRRFRPRSVAVLALVVGLGFTALQAAAVPSFLEGVRDGMNEALEDEAQDARDSGEATEIAPLKLRKGDCFDDPDVRQAMSDETVEAESVTLLPCRRRHDLEVYAIVRVPGDSFPGQAAIDRRANRCLELFKRFVGLSYADSRFESYFYFPTRQTWTLFEDRSIVCALGHPDRKVRGSLRDRRR